MRTRMQTRPVMGVTSTHVTAGSQITTQGLRGSHDANYVFCQCPVLNAVNSLTLLQSVAYQV